MERHVRHGPRIVFDMPIRFHLKTLLDDYLASVVQDGAALGSAEMGPPTTGFTTSNLKWELAPGSHAIEWVQADEFKMCLRYSIGLSQFRKPLAGTTELATRTGHPHRPPAQATRTRSSSRNSSDDLAPQKDRAVPRYVAPAYRKPRLGPAPLKLKNKQIAKSSFSGSGPDDRSLEPATNAAPSSSSSGAARSRSSLDALWHRWVERGVANAASSGDREIDVLLHQTSRLSATTFTQRRLPASDAMFNIILAPGQTEFMSNQLSTGDWYAKVHRLLIMAGRATASTSIRMHLPGDRSGFLHHFVANHARFVVSGAPPVWHVSSVTGGKQHINFSIDRDCFEEQQRSHPGL